MWPWENSSKLSGDDSNSTPTKPFFFSSTKNPSSVFQRVSLRFTRVRKMRMASCILSMQHRKHLVKGTFLEVSWTDNANASAWDCIYEIVNFKRSYIDRANARWLGLLKWFSRNDEPTSDVMFGTTLVWSGQLLIWVPAVDHKSKSDHDHELHCLRYFSSLYN